MAPSIPDSVWEELKDELWSLYIGQDLKLVDVMRMMHDTREFRATKAQYLTRFKRWGFRKNLSGPEWVTLGAKLHRRGQKNAHVYMNGIQFNERKIAKELARYSNRNLLCGRYYDMRACTPPTPEGVMILDSPLNQSVDIFDMHSELLDFLPAVVDTSNAQGLNEYLQFLQPEFNIFFDRPTTELTTPQLQALPPALLHSELVGISKGILIRLFVFMVSNNLIPISDRQNDSLYWWIRAQCEPSQLVQLLRVRGCATQALTENLLNLAFEYTDRVMLLELVRSGNCLLGIGEMERYIGTMIEIGEAYGHDDKELMEYLKDSGFAFDSVSITEVYVNRIDATTIETAIKFLSYGIQFPQYFLIEALKLSICMADLEAVEALVEAGATTDFDELRDKPVFFLTEHSEATRLFLNEKYSSIADCLIRAGVNICKLRVRQDQEEADIIDVAALRGYTKLIRALHQHGAEVTVNTLAYAYTNGHTETYEYLRNAQIHISPSTVDAASLLGYERISHLLSRERDKREMLKIRSAILIGAIYHGRKEVTSKFLYHKIPILATGGLTYSKALRSAAERADKELFEHLLDEKSGYRHITIEQLQDPLEGALQAGHDELAMMLALHLPYGIEVTPWSLDRLPNEVNSDILKILLHKGIPIDAVGILNIRRISTSGLDRYNEVRNVSFIHSILPRVITIGDLKLIQTYLEAGASINAFGCDDLDTPLSRAVATGNQDLVRFLLDQGADINNAVHNLVGRTPLRAAVIASNHDMIDFLLSQGAPLYDECALLEAVRQRNEFLLCSLLDIASLKNRPQTYGCWALKRAVELNSVLMVKILLVNDIDPTVIPESTRAGICTEFGREERTDFGVVTVMSALGTAIETGVQSDTQIIEMLLRRCGAHNSIVFAQKPELGRSYNLRETHVLGAKNQLTALLYAIKKEKISFVKLLVRGGAELNPGQIPGVVATPLQMAAKMGNLEILNFLLVKGALVNAPAHPNRGSTALQCAAAKGFANIVSILVARDADVDAPRALCNGRTALEEAAANGRFYVIRQLLSYGVSINVSNINQFERAIDYARTRRYLGCAQLLEEEYERRVNQLSDDMVFGTMEDNLPQDPLNAFESFEVYEPPPQEDRDDLRQDWTAETFEMVQESSDSYQNVIFDLPHRQHDRIEEILDEQDMLFQDYHFDNLESSILGYV